MKVAIIAPIDNLELTQKGNIHMVLTHLVLKSAKYAKFYANEEKYKILDNGAFEGELHKIEDVVKAAEIVGANEIILPDLLYQKQGTIDCVIQAIEWLKENNLMYKYKLMAVPQGQTKEEWWECFEKFYNMDEINVIGLSKLSCPLCFKNSITESRLEISHRLEEFSFKQYHLLGGSGTVLIEMAQQSPLIRSIDTSVPVHYGRKRIHLKSNTLHLKTSINFDRSIKPYSMQTVQSNIKLILKMGHQHDNRSKKDNQ